MPTFTLRNYIDIFTSALTFNLYWTTIKFTVLTWLFSLIIGFWVAYFLVFHVRNPLLAIGLFLLCTVPFWTSNIIRMISWIPLLGKEGLINSALIGVGVIDEPLELLLFSELRGGGRLCPPADDLHDRADLQFAWPASTSAWSRRRSTPAPAASTSCASSSCRCRKNGIALGSIFVVSIVMGDFFVVKVMSGGGSASVVGAFYEDVGVLQYPIAAASAVLLTIVVIA